MRHTLHSFPVSETDIETDKRPRELGKGISTHQPTPWTGQSQKCWLTPKNSKTMLWSGCSHLIQPWCSVCLNSFICCTLFHVTHYSRKSRKFSCQHTKSYRSVWTWKFHRNLILKWQSGMCHQHCDPNIIPFRQPFFPVIWYVLKQVWDFWGLRCSNSWQILLFVTLPACAAITQCFIVGNACLQLLISLICLWHFISDMYSFD